MNTLRDTQGFTLIELLIVVVIIGILAAIAIPQFASTKEKAFDAAAKSDIRNMQTAEEAYYADFQQYAGANIAAAPGGGSADLDSDGQPDAKASPNVGVTASSATNGYTITAKHTSSNSTWCIDTTPTGKGIVVDQSSGC